MNTEFFIAKRLTFDKENKKNISYTIAKIATFSIALSLSVMIIAIAVVTGFKKEIRKKVIGFGSHIQIVNFDFNTSYETKPVKAQQDFYPGLTDFKGIKHIQVFAVKPGIIKTETDVQGIVLKGIDKDFDWSFFIENMVQGSPISISDSAKTKKVVVSKYIANLLHFNLEDEFIVYFPIGERARYLRLQIGGIYETGLEEFDKQFMLVDIKHIQRLNQWSKDEISGFEVLISDFKLLERMTQLVFNEVALNFQEDGSSLRIENIKEKYPQIFDWINLQNMNVITLLVLTLMIAILNMITGLLILILERTNMIGILKSFGAANQNVRQIFLYQAGFLVLRGLFWGNLIGLCLCLVQHHFELIKLDQSSYWLSTVPVNLNAMHVIALNIGSLLVIMSVLIIPSIIISKIQPSKTIRFN